MMFGVVDEVNVVVVVDVAVAAIPLSVRIK